MKSLKKKKKARRLNAFEFRVSNIDKAIDDILVYSYQYNIKTTRVLQGAKKVSFTACHSGKL